MSGLQITKMISPSIKSHWLARLLPIFVCALFGSTAQAEGTTACERTLTANIVALDQPVLFNRLGAANVNGMIFALERDVVDKASGKTLNNGGAAVPGQVALRRDKRPRPLILRVVEGDCLEINLTNLLTAGANPNKVVMPPQFNVLVDQQVKGRNVSFQVSGLEWASSGPGAPDAASHVGLNSNSTIEPGKTVPYKLYAPEEGVFVARGMASTVGSNGNQGNSANLLFGQVIVEPRGARIYRSQTTEEEMRLASMDLVSSSLTCGQRNLTADGQPIIDYEASYPVANCDDVNIVDGVNLGGTGNDLGAVAWIAEGKDGLPLLNMICGAAGEASLSCTGNEIVHSDIHAIVAGPDLDGSWTGACGNGDGDGLPFEGPCPYPLESVGKYNPTLPNRLEAFRDFASAWHGETATAQAFQGYFDDTVFNYVLAGVGDGFMINYGSGGIGSEIIANRLGVGPMHDCLSCAFEEFFLTAYTVGDPAQLADVSANIGLEHLKPGIAPPEGSTGPKATWVPYPDDPSNVHHSYIGDFVKIRNTHIGNENHVFHLHNHQWLYNPNDDNSNYLDAQGIGPGSSYTYEINFGGSGNRIKSAGDAIYHCHFYPHFAQGMWYMWRNHDVMETGTPLQVSGGADSFHAEAFALEDGTPRIVGTDARGLPIRARALPDGEIVAGAPIPALIPLPGKPMPPIPGEVQVVANELLTTASTYNPAPGPDQVTDIPGDLATLGIQVPVGSLAKVVQRDVNPGYPFWIAGIEDTVGQRPPTPPMDMATGDLVRSLNSDYGPGPGETKQIYHREVWKAHATQADRDLGCLVSDKCTLVRNLFDDLVPEQADGWDGGLPRAALQGYSAGGVTAHMVTSKLDFSKVIGEAKAVFFPEEGTDVEQTAMAFHSVREHSSYKVDMDGNVLAANFILNGNKPAIGAPYHEPCMDDQGDRFDTRREPLDPDRGDPGLRFWGKKSGTYGDDASQQSEFDADTPRIYKGVNIQFDAVLNKAGYHYPQQRILTLWEDAVPVIRKEVPPEPMVLRFNSFECGVYHHANLVPEYYELDDYQIRTPTDIIGQHIHLPKWDLTTADGAANGWNYEDGTLSPGAVVERIHAVNKHITNGGTHLLRSGAEPVEVSTGPLTSLLEQPHPFFGCDPDPVTGDLGCVAPPGGIRATWMGARTTMQRWFFDPVINSDGIDRGLGIIFTHDHYGPSTHQQVGLYATVLVEPAKSVWAHNETGEQLGCRTPGDVNCRADGGPTSWQAAITPDAAGSTLNPAGQLEPFREFYFEYSDFQHAYEAGIYVGADQDGKALDFTGPDAGMMVMNTGHPVEDCGTATGAFRCAINPPGIAQVSPGIDVYPDLVLEASGASGKVAGCTVRPCPMAIDAEDPGMFAVNYRNEPIGLRVYDPNRKFPGDNKFGMQADGLAGDLAFALQSRTDRAIPEFRRQPLGGEAINGTIFPPPINAAGVGPGDPFTPMMRTYVGDLVRVKMQAGGDEEEHNATIHGLKWLQAGSAFGSAPNSGWRNNQAGGISEQFTLTTPIVPVEGNTRQAFIDYAYTMDASQDGWWSGLWGLMRAYELPRTDLSQLANTQVPISFSNADQFTGVCPNDTLPAREFDITAVAANVILPTNADVELQGGIKDVAPNGHLGNAPNASGGTLVYNPRTTTVGGQTVTDEDGNTVVLPSHQGPLHDPTALLYVHTDDLVEYPITTAEISECNRMGVYFFDSPEMTMTLVSRRRVRGVRYNYDYTYKVDFSNNGVAAQDVTAKVTSKATGITITDGDLSFGAVPGASYPDTFTFRWNRRYPFDAGNIEFEFTGAVDGDGGGIRNAACPVKLRTGVKVEPLILRAAAGDCIDVTLRNRLPAVANELPTLATLLGVTKRDRLNALGSTTFQTNLMETSGYAGLHPQLVAFDVSRSNGILVGLNESGEYNTLAGVVPPEGGVERMRWYAGDLAARKISVDGVAKYELHATPVEFGAANLMPADVIKQGMKSLVGQLVIEPEGSTFDDEYDDEGGRQTATVTYTPPGPGGVETSFRDFSVVLTKGQTQYYVDGTPVEHVNGEGAAGIPEDSQAGSGMAINYAIEPIWFRLGLLPSAHFGHDDGAAGAYGNTDQLHVYSNDLAGVGGPGVAGDPVTPVFHATAGDEVRMRLGVPHATNRGTVFALHGHAWQRDPYLAQYTEHGGIPRSYAAGGPGLGSVTIGQNPLAFYQGGQESLYPSAHYDIVLPSAGGTFKTPGDYLFRDVASANVASGLWGILRLKSAPSP